MISKEKIKELVRDNYLYFFIFVITFVIMFIGKKIGNVNENGLFEEIFFLFLYLIEIVLIAKNDRKEREINKVVLYYGMLVACANIVYLCLIDQNNIYVCTVYLVTLIIILILDARTQLNEARSSYLYDNLALIVLQLFFFGKFATIVSIAIIILSMFIIKGVYTIKNALNKYRKENVKIFNNYKFGFMLSTIGTILYIGQLYFI